MTKDKEADMAVTGADAIISSNVLLYGGGSAIRIGRLVAAPRLLGFRPVG